MFHASARFAHIQVRAVRLESNGPKPQQNRAIAYLCCSNESKLCRNCDQKFNLLKCDKHDQRMEDCESCSKECHDHFDALNLLKRKIMVRSDLSHRACLLFLIILNLST